MSRMSARARTAHQEPSRITSGRAARQPWVGLAHLGVVYVIWGSTYLAIRVAVREGSGFPPFAMASTRVLVAGAVVLLVAGATGRRVRLTTRDLIVLVGTGLLMWVGGNGLIVLAEQRAASGFAALLVAAVPIWTAAIEAALDRRPPTLSLVLALLVGLAGVGVLSTRGAESAGADPWSVATLLAASVTWTVGSILQRRKAVDLPPLTSSAYQLLFGGIGLAAIALAVGEPAPHPTPDAWLAWGYLVVFGSLLGFTSFVQVLQLLPITLAMTYSYVNPVIAVILGWLLLGESITLSTVVGMVLVIAGVAGVFRVRREPAH